MVEIFQIIFLATVFVVAFVGIIRVIKNDK